MCVCGCESVRVSGSERKIVSITVFFVVFFFQSIKAKDHIGSMLLCPTGPHRTKKMFKDLQPVQHPLTYRSKFTSNFCTQIPVSF